jgi:hypothetical protein
MARRACVIAVARITARLALLGSLRGRYSDRLCQGDRLCQQTQSIASSSKKPTHSFLSDRRATNGTSTSLHSLRVQEGNFLILEQDQIRMGGKLLPPSGRTPIGN